MTSDFVITSLHTPEAMLDYYECPAYWYYNYVRDDLIPKISQEEGLNRLLVKFCLEKLPLTKTQSVHLHDLRDMLGDWLVQTKLYKDAEPEVQAKMLVDAVEKIENIHPHLFEGNTVRSINVEAGVYVDPGLARGGHLRFNIPIIFALPIRLVYLTHRHFPRTKGAIERNPVFFCLAVLNRRLTGKVHNTNPPKFTVISMVDQKPWHPPQDSSKYKSGPNWSRMLDGMDALAAYQRDGKQCEVCPYQDDCSSEQLNTDLLSYYNTNGKKANTKRFYYVRARQKP